MAATKSSTDSAFSKWRVMSYSKEEEIKAKPAVTNAADLIINFPYQHRKDHEQQPDCNQC